MANETPCTMCWKAKDTSIAHPEASESALVCAGCRFDIQRVLGYLGYHGVVVISAADGDAFHEARRAAVETAVATDPLTPSSEPGNKGKARPKK
jgi:hypothetical protein